MRTAFDARVTVIFGPSGAGKSTLFEVLLGITEQARGRAELAGEVLQDTAAGVFVPAWRRRLGWVPQDAALIPHRTVSDNLRLGAGRAAATAPALLRRAVEVLELGALLGRPVEALSGGERQRVALARALASDPRALLLDEPLASLDVALRARVLPYLLRVREELGLPMLIITHDPDEALLLGEHVVVMDAGRVVAEGRPAETLWSVAALPLSEALGLENVLEGRVLGSRDGEAEVRTERGLRLHVAGSLPVGDCVRLGLRAQDILLAASAPERISARNVFRARVVTCETHEGSVLVHLEAGDILVAKVTPRAAEALALREGAGTFVVVKAQAFRRLL